MPKLRNPLGYDRTLKVLGTASAVTAALAARSALTAAWSAVSDRDPPLDLENDDTGWSQALTFCVISGALAGVARLLARTATTRGLKAWAERL